MGMFVVVLICGRLSYAVVGVKKNSDSCFCLDLRYTGPPHTCVSSLDSYIYIYIYFPTQQRCCCWLLYHDCLCARAWMSHGTHMQRYDIPNDGTACHFRRPRSAKRGNHSVYHVSTTTSRKKHWQTLESYVTQYTLLSQNAK